LGTKEAILDVCGFGCSNQERLKMLSKAYTPKPSLWPLLLLLLPLYSSGQVFNIT
jgi:hypothetical protein